MNRGSRVVAGLVSLLPAVLLPVPTTRAQSVAYHVDSLAGDDARDGCGPAAAWRTPETVNATTFQPGDRVLLKGGTGFVLPALAEGDPAFAQELATELIDQLTKFDVAEWLTAQGRPNGARRFPASVSMPLLARRALTEKRPLFEYF